MEIITIQPGNTPDGTYDVDRPLPYPFHVESASGEIGRQDFWKGAPARVLGFQCDRDRQEVDISWEDAADHPELIEGKFVVLLDTSETEPRIYNHTCPIVSVSSAKYTTPDKGERE